MYTDNFLSGMQELNLITPTFITKATEYIPQQLQLVRILKDKGFTYQIDDGIYFDTSKFELAVAVRLPGAPVSKVPLTNIS